MDIFMALIMIIAGFFFLVKGADLFVDSASGIAGKLGISPVVIGLTIVAFGTSMPELAVSAEKEEHVKTKKGAARLI